MASYIGTAISRIDGRAKVTGAARYAGEFDAPRLAHASLVTATIARAASSASTPRQRSPSKASSTY